MIGGDICSKMEFNLTQSQSGTGQKCKQQKLGLIGNGHVNKFDFSAKVMHLKDRKRSEPCKNIS